MKQRNSLDDRDLAFVLIKTALLLSWWFSEARFPITENNTSSLLLWNQIAGLGNFNNGWAVVPVVPLYFPFMLRMSFSPHRLTRALNQLKDFHVPAAVRSWIVFVLVLWPLTCGQEEGKKCTLVTSNIALYTKARGKVSVRKLNSLSRFC